jgi:hypothetical protein
MQFLVWLRSYAWGADAPPRVAGGALADRIFS